MSLLGTRHWALTCENWAVSLTNYPVTSAESGLGHHRAVLSTEVERNGLQCRLRLLTSPAPTRGLIIMADSAHSAFKEAGI